VLEYSDLSAAWQALDRMSLLDRYETISTKEIDPSLRTFRWVILDVFWLWRSQMSDPLKSMQVTPMNLSEQ
jgi:hypothetical protein